MRSVNTGTELATPVMGKDPTKQAQPAEPQVGWCRAQMVPHPSEIMTLLKGHYLKILGPGHNSTLREVNSLSRADLQVGQEKTG